MNCNRCGNTFLFAEESGSQTGVYCAKCGKWIKWASKDEKRVIPNKTDAIKAMNASHPLVIENKYKEIEKIVNSPDYYTLGSLDKIAEVVKG